MGRARKRSECFRRQESLTRAPASDPPDRAPRTFLQRAGARQSQGGFLVRGCRAVFPTPPPTNRHHSAGPTIRSSHLQLTPAHRRLRLLPLARRTPPPPSGLPASPRCRWSAHRPLHAATILTLRPVPLRPAFGRFLPARAAPASP